MLNSNKLVKKIQMKADYSLVEHHVFDGINTEIAHRNSDEIVDSFLKDLKKDLNDKLNKTHCFNSKHNNYNKVFEISINLFVVEEAHKQ